MYNANGFSKLIAFHGLEFLFNRAEGALRISHVAVDCCIAVLDNADPHTRPPTGISNSELSPCDDDGRRLRARGTPD